jgi:hypothetical protein
MNHENKRATLGRENISLRNLRHAVESRGESKIVMVATVALAYNLVSRLEGLPGSSGATAESLTTITIPE